MIYSLSSSTSFCDTLAAQWLSQKADEVWGLSKITAILPTNRAAKTFKEAFLRQSKGKTILLPKILSFADMDFLSADIPDAISPLTRQLLLAKLIQQKQSMSADKAFTLAASLAELIDQMHHYDVDFEQLQKIAPDNFAGHWQQTLCFLEIIQTFWPQILSERGQLDPSLRQIRLVENLIKSWHENPPTNPIIAVGFTGGLPIVERFLKAVDTLPNSDIYIPNLDKTLTDEEWEKLDATHPQFYIKRLLDYLDISREQVIQADNLNERFSLLSTALTPASATDNWQEKSKTLSAKSVQNMCLIECKTPATEAFEIACLLREVLEEPRKTAALVTTDRQLARRVRIQMARWDIILDDSAGTPLARTPIGTFLILLAEAAASGKSTDLLSLLKHPLSLDGDDFNAFRKKIHKAEYEARSKKTHFTPELKTDMQAFAQFFINPVRVPLEQILRAHLDVAQSLAASADKTGAQRLWDKESGQVASTLLTELLSHGDILGEIEPVTYPAFITAILNSQTVRPKYGMHPRLDILGPIEARLQQPDVLIIGGMNEGTFPQLPETDPWINRPMRTVCGLPSPEEKIGVSAQDFLHLMQAPEVILTRALKVDGTPSIPSRWLERLQAVLQAANIEWIPQNEVYSPLLQGKNDYVPVGRPMPSPPVEARPTTLSISDIATFLNDPYAIYAKRVLHLYKLDELDEQISVADFGTAVHNAAAAYLKLSKSERTLETLLQLGNKELTAQNIIPEENPFLTQKFNRIAAWFCDTVQEAFPQTSSHLLEVEGQMDIPLSNGNVTIKGRADRIDIFPDKTATIIDYKTGGVPKKIDVAKGLAPQLPLEAIMLQRGAFGPLPDLKIADLSYWRLIGKKVGGEIIPVTPENINDFLSQVLEGLTSLLSFYQLAETPYPACPKPKNQPRYNDYALLERLDEWQTAESEGDS